MSLNYDVIIIGAGAAGLMAASELAAARKTVLVLEARDRLGGRIHTIREKNVTIEAGAEFIHGRLPLTLQLLKRAHIAYEKTRPNIKRSENGQWSRNSPFEEGWDELIAKMRALKKDIVFKDFLNLHVNKESQKKLMDAAIGYAQGFDLADISKASTMALFREWTAEDDSQYRISKGYVELIQYLKRKCMRSGCHILTGQPVKNIQWKKDAVTISTQNKMTYQSKKLLVTVPLGVLHQSLKAKELAFKPALPSIARASRQIGYGSVLKISLLFSNLFLPKKTKLPGLILSDQFIPTWWVQQFNQDYLLTGWLGGPPARKFCAQKDSLILQTSIESLANILSADSGFLATQLKTCHIFKWDLDPWSRGGYSYAKPASEAAKKVLNQPIKKTIYFAGEGVYSGKSPGTVEAALYSGKEAAEKILETER